ncbi:MTH1187 family thiamine-binding protein [Thiohalorhabdus methylotrophus]|uniref:MTH1187 family thiamine-binding protein n=1 Tax=Thiohalorhabdus methylotrophus TaxID=3242694 RepID=A0ABV4TYL1_9GAMM
MAYTVNYSVIPLTHSGGHVGDLVAKVVDRVEKSGLEYRLTAMGTQIEGDLDEVLDLVKECERLVEADSDRFYTVLTMDYQKGKGGALSAKVQSVEDRLGHTLNK